MMALVLDASMVAAWLLPEEHSQAAEDLIAGLDGPCPVPSLFWHEVRSILLIAERRGRIDAGEALTALGRMRRLPLEDAGAGADAHVMAIARTQALSAYDAAYLALALDRALPLATLDRKLAVAARHQGVAVLGPHGASATPPAEKP
ncbi:MAG: type II toxin-antitoxin system VapC family toxin [Mesorhizobium sp.]|uniref:type II toxin-antitoxin system VapC family toxin n=1 Tax=Mesorhizobium sp. TaxID=1871066 RepID=UPI0011FB1D84|nr:type II toxin-antitoxin system VapC family toxin [Mesorhizobium sp.]TIR15679.1 MAG: type II toxin-antitoxin system VapC family toxin [Mesorhizobium sp.]